MRQGWERSRVMGAVATGVAGGVYGLLDRQPWSGQIGSGSGKCQLSDSVGGVVETIGMPEVWVLCQLATVTMTTSAGVGNGDRKSWNRAAPLNA